MYDVIPLRGETDSSLRSEITSLWVTNNIFSSEGAQRQLENAILGVRDFSSKKLIAVSTAKLKYNSHLRGYYYHYGIFSLPCHGSRPTLLRRTFEHMQIHRGNSVRGMAIQVKNPKITSRVLMRYGFEKPPPEFFTPPNLFYRNFNLTLRAANRV